MATPQNIGAPPPNANKISIVTKSEIRYEGILYHINPQDQNITLCNVKSFGTEGRRPGDEIGPSPQMHEYIIFRGSDIKDLKVIETAQTQSDAPTSQIEKPLEHSAPKEQVRSDEKDIKMGKEGNQEDFDFQAMKEKFHQFTLDHKGPELNSKAYAQKDFFDSLSTSTGEKTREIPFDRVAQKKVDKETFGSEYVDTATSRGRGGYRRGGYRGGGGQNRRYGGNQGNRNYGGGQNYGGQNYGGQNRYQNRGGYDNQQEGGHGGQGGYRGGYGGQNRYQNRGGYDNQQEGGHGGQEGGHGGQEGGHGGQGGYRGGYGGQNRYQNRGGYDNQQEGGHGGQGGYGGHGGQGGYNQGGYNQGGRGGKYQNQSGPRYYKTYQTVGHDQDNQQQQQGNEEGFKKYEQGNDEGFRKY